MHLKWPLMQSAEHTGRSLESYYLQTTQSMSPGIYTNARGSMNL